jgi:hypothetical protein
MSAPLPYISGQTHLETVKLVFIGHVRLLSQTYPALDLRGIKGVSHTPLNPRLLFHFSTSLLAPPSSPKAIVGPLQRISLVSRGFASPNPRDLQTLVGFSSPKVYSRILQDLLSSSLISCNAWFHMPCSTSRMSFP